MKSGEGVGIDVEGGIGPTKARRGRNCCRMSVATCRPCIHPSPDFPFAPFSRLAYRQTPCRMSRRRAALLRFFRTRSTFGIISEINVFVTLPTPTTSNDSQNNGLGIAPRLPVLILILFRTSFAFKSFGRLYLIDRRFDGCLDHAVYVNEFKRPHRCIHALRQRI